MLAYAANRPRIAQRSSSPNALLVVIGVHVAALAVVMSAKMDLPIRPDPGPVLIDPLRDPPPPPPNPTRRAPRPQGPTTTHDPSPMPPLPNPPFPTPPTADPGPAPGPGPAPIPEPVPSPKPVGASSGPHLLTSASELKPPYPASKLLNEEEATLTLRLTIDQSGRVIAVQPVGRNDPVFLEAARRYLIAHWRYKPALEDGQAIASSVVITLRFELDG